MFYKIAHRGASGYLPENTLKSFQKAISLKANAIELDVRLSKDGVPVIIHDKKINRLSQEKGLVKNKSLLELEKLGFFSLEKILNNIPKKTIINIEIKEKKSIKPLINLLQTLTQQNKIIINNFIISSFNFSILNYFHSLMPEIKIGMLVKRKFFLPFQKTAYLKKLKKINAFSVHIHYKNITPYLIQYFHQYNLLVFAYTINSKKKVLQLKKWKIDGIFSDYPDILS